MTDKKFLMIWAVTLIIIGGLFYAATFIGDPSALKDAYKELDGLKTNIQMLDANVRILTETLTKYEEELRVCRSRPLCTDPVIIEAKRPATIELMPKFEVPDHSPEDEEPKGN